MCGVTVIVSVDRQAALALGERFASALHRRGPDGVRVVCVECGGGVVVVMVASVLHIR